MHELYIDVSQDCIMNLKTSSMEANCLDAYYKIVHLCKSLSADMLIITIKFPNKSTARKV